MEKLEKLLKMYLDEIEKNEDDKNKNSLKIVCACGSNITEKNKKSHEISKKHLNYLSNINKEDVKEEKIEEKGEELKILNGGKFLNTVKMVNSIDDIKNESKEIKKKKQLRRSNYFLTINTNQRYQEFNEEFEPFFKKFESSLNDLFNNYMNDIIKLKEEGNINEDIKNVNTEFCIEKGPKTNCIHGHCLISIAHYNNILLNFDFIVNFIKQKLELPNIYLSSKVFNNDKLSLKDYLEKTKKN